MDVKITKKQCENLAIAIHQSNFRMFGVCNFDLSRDDVSEVLYIAFNSKNRCNDLETLYEKLYNSLGE